MVLILIYLPEAVSFYHGKTDFTHQMAIANVNYFAIFVVNIPESILTTKMLFSTQLSYHLIRKLLK